MTSEHPFHLPLTDSCNGQSVNSSHIISTLSEALGKSTLRGLQYENPVLDPPPNAISIECLQLNHKWDECYTLIREALQYR